MTDPYADFRSPEKPAEAAFAELDTLINEMHALETDVDIAEANLKRAQADLREVAEKRIPELLDQMGVESITRNGQRVTVKNTIRASIPAAKRPAAYSWLEQNGHGGLIKRTVAVAFDREQQEQATKLAGDLREDFDNVQQNMKVEPASLTALIKELLSEGVEVPDDIFSVHETRQTKVK